MSFKKTFLTILIIGILIVTAVGIWQWNSNSYSKGNLKLEIIGSDKAKLGQEVEYIVKYKNNGNTRLEEPKLVFEFPEHSLVEEQRKEFELEDIYPGQEKTKKFTGEIIGKEGQTKVAKASLNYRPKNLSASFESNTTHTTIIEEVPLNFELDLPSVVKPESEMNFDVSYFSNVDYPLSDLRVAMEYPSGFEFKSAQPQGLSDTEWEVGLLNRAEGGKIDVTGELEGELEEEKVFDAKLGMWQEGDFVTLKKASRGVELGEPSLYISQEINGEEDYVASPGETLHYEIYFKNVGDEALSDMFLASNLKGKGFDYDSLNSTQGSFREGDNSVVFDSREVSKLEFLDTGEEGKVEFWVDVKEEWEPRTGEPILTNQVALQQDQEEFVTKVNSGLALEQVGYYENEAFSNSGPIPPEVGETTQYAVMWKPRVNFGKVEDAQVSAQLPENVELTEEIFPEEEEDNFEFDEATGELTWDVGVLGGTSTSPNITFQAELTPDSSQRDSGATLVEEAEITGTDVATEKDVSATSSAVDTLLERLEEEEGIVQ